MFFDACGRESVAAALVKKGMHVTYCDKDRRGEMREGGLGSSDRESDTGRNSGSVAGGKSGFDLIQKTVHVTHNSGLPPLVVEDSSNHLPPPSPPALVEACPAAPLLHPSSDCDPGHRSHALSPSAIIDSPFLRLKKLLATL